MSVSNVLFRATNTFLGLATLGSSAFLVSLMYNAATTYQAQVSKGQKQGKAVCLQVRS